MILTMLINRLPLMKCRKIPALVMDLVICLAVYGGMLNRLQTHTLIKITSRKTKTWKLFLYKTLHISQCFRILLSINYLKFITFRLLIRCRFMWRSLLLVFIFNICLQSIQAQTNDSVFSATILPTFTLFDVDKNES